jgi:hypothetical protein
MVMAWTAGMQYWTLHNTPRPHSYLYLYSKLYLLLFVLSSKHCFSIGPQFCENNHGHAVIYRLQTFKLSALSSFISLIFKNSGLILGQILCNFTKKSPFYCMQTYITSFFFLCQFCFRKKYSVLGKTLLSFCVFAKQSSQNLSYEPITT